MSVHGYAAHTCRENLFEVKIATSPRAIESCVYDQIYACDQIVKLNWYWSVFYARFRGRNHANVGIEDGDGVVTADVQFTPQTRRGEED